MSGFAVRDTFYNSRRFFGSSRGGYFLDLSNLAPGAEHHLDVWLTQETEGLYWENVETQYDCTWQILV